MTTRGDKKHLRRFFEKKATIGDGGVHVEITDRYITWQLQ